jgi:8-oxo-dGTP diphosphatase
MINKDTVGVCCEMIIQKDGKILMGKRGNVFGKGNWAFPGGHLEVGETIEDCAKRELKEETGIEPTKIKLIGIINDIRNIPGQSRQYIRFVFLIEDFSGEVVNKEPDRCEGWKWFSLDKLPKPIFVGHVKVLEFFLSDRKSFFIEK